MSGLSGPVRMSVMLIEMYYCNNMSRCVRIRMSGCVGCVRICQDVSGRSGRFRICHVIFTSNMSRLFVRMDEDVSRCVGCARICQDVSGCIRVCQGVSRCVRVCQDTVCQDVSGCK